MTNKVFEVDGIEIAGFNVEESPTLSKFMDKELLHFEFSFITLGGGPMRSKMLEVGKKDAVVIVDRQTGQPFQGKFAITQHSYQDGRPETQFRATITELDTPPEVHELEINGTVYPVFGYEASDHRGYIIHRTLLALTEQQFPAFSRLYHSKETVQAKRIGVDSEAREYHLGGPMEWSKHEENGQVIYRQMANLIPLESKQLLDWANGRDFRALSRITFSLINRFEKLLAELQSKGVLTQEAAQEILAGSYNEDIQYPHPHIEELRWSFRQVDDAEAEFKD